MARGTVITVAVALILVYVERTNGMLESCSASECATCFCSKVDYVASCDVDLLVEEDGAIFQYIINCTAPPECEPMPVNPDSPSYCVVVVEPVGNVGGDWSYQAANFKFSDDTSTCEEQAISLPLTPDCTALSKKCLYYYCCH